MKKLFLFGIVGGILLGVGLYFAWRIIDALAQVFRNWRYEKELAQIAREAEARRAARPAQEPANPAVIDGYID